MGCAGEATADSVIKQSIAELVSEAESLRSSPQDLFRVASALLGIGALDEGSRVLAESLKHDPNDADALWACGVLHLLQGNYLAGFPLYERRWDLDSLRSTPFHTHHPVWQGGDLRGDRILIFCEQGFGDTLQMVRFLPQVEAAGGQVTLVVPPELLSLLSSIRGVERVVTYGTRFPKCQWRASLMSLPLLLSVTLDLLPYQRRYVGGHLPGPAPEPRSAVGRRKIGVVWAGNPRHARDRKRSIALSMLMTYLCTVPNADFVSLQTGARQAEIHDLPEHMAVQELEQELKDFEETARLVNSLDLVLTVDTAVAHLAGAMGRPVWILLTNLPDWRWLLDREDSPWYPSARLFRQQVAGDWDTPLRKLAEELTDFCTASTGA